MVATRPISAARGSACSTPWRGDRPSLRRTGPASRAVNTRLRRTRYGTIRSVERLSMPTPYSSTCMTRLTKNPSPVISLPSRMAACACRASSDLAAWLLTATTGTDGSWRNRQSGHARRCACRVPVAWVYLTRCATAEEAWCIFVTTSMDWTRWRNDRENDKRLVFVNW